LPSLVPDGSLRLQLPDAIDEALAQQILLQLGYTLRVSRIGIHYYADAPNVRPLIFDFGLGFIPLADFVRTLENEGVNLDAFYAILEAI